MSKAPCRLRVGVNMAMSADGKVSTYRHETISLGTQSDRHLMDVLRAKADAVVIGARTLSLDGWAIRVRDPAVRARRLRRKRRAHPLNVVVTTDLRLPLDAQFFTCPETRKLVITTRLAPSRRVARFRKIAEVVVLPKRRVQPQDVLGLLSERGVERVLLEGGGTLNFSFFREDLVDELYITVTPRILGGRTAPTPVDGTGFLKDSHVRLKLASVRRRGDEVFLKYCVVKRGEARAASGHAPRPSPPGTRARSCRPRR